MFWVYIDRKNEHFGKYFYVEMYSNLDELDEKIEYYVDDDKVREEIDYNLQQQRVSRVRPSS